MSRYDAFLALKTNLHYAKYFAQLSTDELVYCAEFIGKNKGLDRSQFVHALHKRLIDTTIKRTKNHILIDELLAVANQNSTGDQ